MALEKFAPYIVKPYDGFVGGLNPLGWTVIELENKNIYITSKTLGLIKAMQQKYAISDDNIANLISEPPIPEPGETGNALPADNIELFRSKLNCLEGKQGNILIHCAAGKNRSPVAAFIYLVESMDIEPAEARRLVENALKARKQHLKLDPYGNYKNIILEVEKQYHERKSAALSNSHSSLESQNVQKRPWMKIPEKEVAEVKEQAKRWYKPH